MSAVKHLADGKPLEQATEFKDLTKGDAIVVYGADWCGPCQAYEPVLEKYASSADALPVIHVDVDRAPELSEKIESVPTTHLYRNGERVAELRGAMNLKNLRTFITEMGAR